MMIVRASTSRNAGCASLLPLVGEGGPAKRGRMRAQAIAVLVAGVPLTPDGPHPTLALARATLSRKREREHLISLGRGSGVVARTLLQGARHG